MIFALTWIPLFFAGLLLCVPAQREALIKKLVFTACGACLVLTLYFFFSFNISQAGYQFVTRINWLPQLGIQYQAGLDGISLTLCLLNALVSFAGAFYAVRQKEQLKLYAFFYLILTGTLYGALTALDLFFLYLFYEASLIPLFPMIGIWGGKNKIYSAMHFTLFLSAGAMLALLGILLLYFQTGLHTFDLIQITNTLKHNPLAVNHQTAIAAFILIGFGITSSLWPFHSWSPVGYGSGPTAANMLHGGVKAGPYLILRLALALLPAGVTHWGTLLTVLSAAGILYAGYAAVSQKDLKTMIAFSSVSHMGYIFLGLAAMTQASVSGAVLSLFSSGIAAAAFFALTGFLQEQTNMKGLDDFGGLGRKVPFIAVSFIMISLASLGLPGFSNFAGELLVFLGAWQKFPAVVGLAVFGILITSLYLLRAIQSVCYGPFTGNWPDLKDARGWQKLPFVLLIGALLVFGFWPHGLLRFITPAAGGLLP